MISLFGLTMLVVNHHGVGGSALERSIDDFRPKGWVRILKNWKLKIFKRYTIAKLLMFQLDSTCLFMMNLFLKDG